MPGDAARPGAAPPSDPAAAFAARAKKALGAGFARCEETWVPGADVPVLLAVLDRCEDAKTARVKELFGDTRWSGDKPVLQVIDATAWEALQTLAAAGMITIQTRATRPLLPLDGRPALPPLTAEKRARIAGLRAAAEKRRRAAKALLAEDLREEAGALLSSAAADEAKADAIESRTA